MDTEKISLDAEALFREIARYLAVVDALRDAGREPVWLPEPHSRAFVRRLPVVDSLRGERCARPPRFTV